MPREHQPQPPSFEGLPNAEQAHHMARPLPVAPFEGAEFYDPDGPITSYVRERVAFLCGNEHEVPAVFVKKDKELNAFAVDGVIAVNDGVFSVLEHQEELDALLAHELQHLMRGHVCGKGHDDPLEDLGDVRKNEIEADALGIRLLDKRGINPLGMIKLADKLARQTTVDGEEPTYASPTHGHSLERQITLQQLLSVLDTRHLSPELHALEPISTEQPIQLGGEAFWKLPIAVQQAQLNTAIKERGTAVQSAQTIQEHILRQCNVASDEADIQHKARLILEHRLDSWRDQHLFRSQVTIDQLPEQPDAELMQRDLTSLEQEDMRALLSYDDRCDIATRSMGKHVGAAILSEHITSGEVEALGAIISRWQETSSIATNASFLDTSPNNDRAMLHPLTLVLQPKFMDHIPVTQHARILQKIGTFARATKFSDIDILTTLANLDRLQGTTLEKNALNVLLAFHEEAISKLPTILDKLYYIGERNISGLSHNQDIGVALDTRLKYALLKMPVAEVTSAFLAFAKNNKGLDRLDRLAKSILHTFADTSLIAFMQRHDMSPAEDSGQTQEQTWKDLLPVRLVALKDELSDFDITHELPDQPKGRMQVLLSRMASTSKAINRLHKTHPGLMHVSMDEVIRETTMLKGALLNKALTGFTKGENDGTPIVDLMQKYGLVRIERGSLYKNPSEVAAISKVWCTAMEKILQQPDWENDEQSLLLLAALGATAPEVELNLTVASFAFEQIARMRDFAGGLQLLEDFPYMRTQHSAVLKVLIEEKATTREELEQLNELVERLYLDAVSDNLGLVGMTSVADTIAIPFYSSRTTHERSVGLKTDVIRGMESSKLLAALLSSSQDETALKQYVAERWWLDKRNRNLAKDFEVESYVFYRMPGKENRLKYWLEHDYPDNKVYTPFDDNLSLLYLTTNEARFFAVRKLLLSKSDGVLRDASRSEELVNALMDSWLAAAEGEEQTVLRDLLLDVITNNDPATSYLHISAMLQDMILRQPQTPANLAVATKSIAEDIMGALIRREKITNVSDKDHEAIHTRVHTLFTGKTKSKPKRHTDPVQDIKPKILEAIHAADTTPPAEKLSTVGFASLAGKKSGALGVKMLQLAGQYFDLTAEDRSAFEGIYDDMQGQTRLQAYNVLKREAEYNPHVAQLFGAIKMFGPRIGGGSLFTVYEVHLKDGRVMALGIQNPNAEYRVARLAEFASRGLEATASKHRDNSTIQLMSALLTDACQWVHDELNDPDFPHKDSVFAAENDTRSGQGFSKGNARYELTTPAVMQTHSPWVRSEAFVDGKNLTGLTIHDDRPTDIMAGIIHRDDFKHVASLLTRNYVHQIMRGKYAHSDIHPGNFRVTPDNKQVVIFDRHNLIPMHDRLRATLRSAFEAIMSDNIEGAALAIALHAAPDSANTEHVVATIREVIHTSSDTMHLITDMVLALKREGVEVPLDLSLLLRNFMSISVLSKQAGFENIAEAFMHTSSGLDELMQLAQ